LVVVPFQGLSGGEGSQLLADGLTNGLIIDLVRFGALQVFAATCARLTRTSSTATALPARTTKGSFAKLIVI
jgi:TolB-like protein